MKALSSIRASADVQENLDILDDKARARTLKHSEISLNTGTFMTSRGSALAIAIR